jgi:hypothetical protein
MSPPSGFVPIPFHRAGQLLLAIGTTGLILIGITMLTGWISLPAAVLILSLSAIVIGLYLIFIVPRERDG